MPDETTTPAGAGTPPALAIETPAPTDDSHAQPATDVTTHAEQTAPTPPAAIPDAPLVVPPAAVPPVPLTAAPPGAVQTAAPPAPPPAGQAGAVAAESGIVGKLEPMLKLAAVGFGLVAAMGLPAVYINFQRFGVPSHFISYDLVLRAGVVPTIPLVLFSLYVYAAVREYMRGEKKLRFLNVPLALSTPIAVVTYLLLLAGLFALVPLELWATLWPVAWVLRKYVGWNLTNRQLLIAPSLIALSVFGVYQIAKRLALRGNFTPSLGQLFRSRLRRDKLGAEAADAATPVARPKAAGEEDESLQLLGLVFLGAPVYSVAMLYCVKGFLYLWSPDWSPAYLSHYYILTSGVTGGLVLGIYFAFVTFSEWLAGTNRRRRLIAFVVIISMVVMVLLASISFYSYSVYPILPQGLGGGKPARVVVWFSHDDLPADLQRRLSRASFGGDDKVARGENLYLLYESADGLILSDGDQPPATGLRIAHDKVKALSW
jgi:hypothetical protein